MWNGSLIPQLRHLGVEFSIKRLNVALGSHLMHTKKLVILFVVQRRTHHHDIPPTRRLFERAAPPPTAGETPDTPVCDTAFIDSSSNLLIKSANRKATAGNSDRYTLAPSVVLERWLCGVNNTHGGGVRLWCCVVVAATAFLVYCCVVAVAAVVVGVVLVFTMFFSFFPSNAQKGFLTPF